jgi:hypothetical protein
MSHIFYSDEEINNATHSWTINALEGHKKCMEADNNLCDIPSGDIIVPGYYESTLHKIKHIEIKRELGRHAEYIYVDVMAAYMKHSSRPDTYLFHDDYPFAAEHALVAIYRGNTQFKGTDGPLVACYQWPQIIMAADLLEQIPGPWREHHGRHFRHWVKENYWPRTQIYAKDNNWGSWGTYARMVTSLYLSRREAYVDCVQSFLARIRRIGEDGTFPEEDRRETPVWYTLFNLAALSACSQVLRSNHNKSSDRHFEAEVGYRGIEKAFYTLMRRLSEADELPLHDHLTYKFLMAMSYVYRMSVDGLWQKFSVDDKRPTGQVWTLAEVIRPLPYNFQEAEAVYSGSPTDVM